MANAESAEPTRGVGLGDTTRHVTTRLSHELLQSPRVESNAQNTRRSNFDLTPYTPMANAANAADVWGSGAGAEFVVGARAGAGASAGVRAGRGC